MKKRIKTTILSLLGASLLAIGCNLCLLDGFAQGEAVWQDVSIGEYNIGNEFVVPNRTLSVSGEDYQANAKVIAPDGKATSQDVVVFDKAGKYTVEYFAEVNGVAYVKTEYIYIRHNAYMYSDENTEVRYLQKGEYQYSPNTEGLYMSIQQGDGVVAQQMMTIPYEDMDICLTSFFVAPQLRGASDMKRIRLRFEDAYDSESYFEVVLNGNYYDRESGGWIGGGYALARAVGQTLKAYDYDKNAVITDQGAGAYLYSGFYGLDYQKKPIDPSNFYTSIYFNPVTCEISAGDCGNKGLGVSANRIKKVIDTNDVAHQGVDAPLWNGFVSGKIKMTVTAEEYVSSAANMVFTYIKDTDLTKEVVLDSAGPRITVHSDYDLQEMPEARVGANCWYPVPTASAIDVYSGKCEVKTYVYFNYLSDGAYLKEVKNGKFCVEEEGQYAIVYCAYDGLGNLSEVVLPVHAGRDLEAWDIVIPTDKTVAASVGEGITLAVPEFSGGSGKTVLTAVAKCGNQAITFDGSMDEWSFVVERLGEWEITYSVVDYTGDVYEESYTLTVSANEVPVFKSVPVLPPIFVEGFRYQLPKAEVYVTDGNVVQVKDAYVEVTAGGDTQRYDGGGEFTPSVVNHKDFITITYKYSTGGETVSAQPIQVPVVRGFEANDKGDKIFNSENFFYSQSETFAFEKTIEGSIFTVKNTDESWVGDSVWTFANPLRADGFTFRFLTYSGCSKGEAYVFRFTDAENPSVSVSGKLYKNKDGQIGVVFGDGNGAVQLDFDDANDLVLSLTGNKFGVDGGAQETACVTAVDDGGKEFARFPSGKIYFTFGVEKARVGAKYMVDSVCGHVFANISRDRIVPKIYLLGDYGGIFEKNEKYVLCAATATDVISPNVRLSVSVFAPDGTYAKDVNGVTLQGVSGWVAYELNVTQIGEYKVEYEAVEEYEAGRFNSGRGNKETLEYSFFAMDGEAPTLSVDGEVPMKVKVGKTVSVPNVTVQDDYSPLEKISVRFYVTTPYGRTEYITAKAFICDKVGVYELRIVAVDESGNATMRTFEITVTK